MHFEGLPAVAAERQQSGVADQQDAPVGELPARVHGGLRAERDLLPGRAQVGRCGRCCRACRRRGSRRPSPRARRNTSPTYGDVSAVQVAPPSSERASVPDSATRNSDVPADTTCEMWRSNSSPRIMRALPGPARVRRIEIQAERAVGGEVIAAEMGDAEQRVRARFFERDAASRSCRRPRCARASRYARRRRRPWRPRMRRRSGCA